MTECSFSLNFDQSLPATESVSEKYCSVLDWRLKVEEKILSAYFRPIGLNSQVTKGTSHLGLFLVCEGDAALVETKKESASWSCQVITLFS